MPNVAQAVWERGLTHPLDVALRGWRGPTWSYGHLRDRSAAWAAAARAAGVQPADRVLLCAPSVPEFAAAYFGLHAAGAVVVTVNTMATEREVLYVLRDAGCALAVAWHASAAATRAAAATVGIPFLDIDPGAPASDGLALDVPYDARAADTAVILYTSGTTGSPKGAQLSVGNLEACAAIFRQALEVGPSDRFGTALPLFHVFGQAVVMGATLTAGGSLSLLERFDAQEMLAMLREDRLTMMAGVPTMWNAMLHAAGDTDASDFASLKLAASGGASLPETVLHAFRERFGCVILEGYGLTETTGAATFNGLHRPRKPGATGIALPGCEVEIRGPDGREVGTGEVGEVHVRGPVVMSGYWRRPEATAQVLADGWLRTGDLGTEDDDGDIRIVDRLKDMIIRGGYNVYPREIEEVLYEHPDIVEVAVVGVPDDHLGEEVAAVVALLPGRSVDAGQLRAWAKERLSAYKIPRLVQVVDELPKGPTGKVLKRAIDPDEVRAAALAASAAP